MITTNKNRNVNFFLVAALGITLILTFALALPTIKPINIVDNQQRLAENQGDAIIKSLSANAFPQYRQSEWHSSEVPVTGISGSETYHQSERTLIPTQAGLMAYQLSEWTLIDPLAEYLASERTLSPIVNPDFSLYHLSERTMAGAVAINDLSQYFASERTLVGPLAGLATYFESERTSIPVQFTPYQISEWFGE